MDTPSRLRALAQDLESADIDWRELSDWAADAGEFLRLEAATNHVSRHFHIWPEPFGDCPSPSCGRTRALLARLDEITGGKE